MKRWFACKYIGANEFPFNSIESTLFDDIKNNDHFKNLLPKKAKDEILTAITYFAAIVRNLNTYFGSYSDSIHPNELLVHNIPFERDFVEWKEYVNSKAGVDVGFVPPDKTELDENVKSIESICHKIKDESEWQQLSEHLEIFRNVHPKFVSALQINVELAPKIWEHYRQYLKPIIQFRFSMSGNRDVFENERANLGKFLMKFARKRIDDAPKTHDALKTQRVSTPTTDSVATSDTVHQIHPPAVGKSRYRQFMERIKQKPMKETLIDALKWAGKFLGRGQRSHVN